MSPPVRGRGLKPFVLREGDEPLRRPPCGGAD